MPQFKDCISLCNFVGSALILGFAFGCTTPPQKTVDQKLQKEPAIAPGESIASRGAQILIHAPGLSEEQKRKLIEIHTSTFMRSAEIREEIGKSKSLLFKMVASPDTKKAEVEALKKRIVKLDRDRLDLMFKALDDTLAVTGKGPAAEEVFRRLEFLEGPRSGHSLPEK